MELDRQLEGVITSKRTVWSIHDSLRSVSRTQAQISLESQRKAFHKHRDEYHTHTSHLVSYMGTLFQL